MFQDDWVVLGKVQVVNSTSNSEVKRSLQCKKTRSDVRKLDTKRKKISITKVLLEICNLPCRKGINLQKTWPKMKSRSKAPTSVKGIQKTPSSRSEKARFSRNRLVTVRILEFWNSVRMTRTLPVMPSRKMVLQSRKSYSGLIPTTVDEHDRWTLHYLTTIHLLGFATIVLANESRILYLSRQKDGYQFIHRHSSFFQQFQMNRFKIFFHFFAKYLTIIVTFDG